MKHSVIAALAARSRRIKALVLFAASSAVLAGCFTGISPYDYMDGWLIRDDAYMVFATQADVIYVQGEIYRDPTHLPLLYARAKNEAGSGRFRGVARVFAPLFSSGDELEQAIEWYFKNMHPKNRPFVFIGEGEGGRMLQEYERENLEDLREKGFMEGFYADDANKAFVDDEMVQRIRDDIARVRYRNVWGRDMPGK